MSVNMKKSEKKVSLSMLVVLAMLVAIEIILSRFLSIAQWNMKFSFAFIPVVAAAILYGPIAGAVVGGVSDFLGAILFPIGFYFPGYTLTAVIIGAVYGMFLYKKQTFLRVITSSLIVNVLCSLILNSFWIAITNGVNYFAMVITRSAQCMIMTAISIVVISLMSLQIMPKLKTSMSRSM